jgi:hypothetical protein
VVCNVLLSVFDATAIFCMGCFAILFVTCLKLVIIDGSSGRVNL